MICIAHAHTCVSTCTMYNTSTSMHIQLCITTEHHQYSDRDTQLRHLHTLRLTSGMMKLVISSRACFFTITFYTVAYIVYIMYLLNFIIHACMHMHCSYARMYIHRQRDCSYFYNVASCLAKSTRTHMLCLIIDSVFCIVPCWK